MIKLRQDYNNLQKRCVFRVNNARFIRPISVMYFGTDRVGIERGIACCYLVPRPVIKIETKR